MTLREFFILLTKTSTKLKEEKHFCFLYGGFHLKRSELDQSLKDLKFEDGSEVTLETGELGSDDKMFSVEDFIEQQKQPEKKIQQSDKTISQQTLKSTKTNWPPLRIIIGVIDSILLAAAITSSILGLHIAISIVLIVLFVLGTIGVVGWKNLLPKYLQKRINLETDLGESNKYKEKKEKIPGPEEDQERNSESSKGENGLD